MNNMTVISVVLLLLTIYQLYIYYKLYNTGNKQNQSWVLQLLGITIDVSIIAQFYGTQLCTMMRK